MRRHARVAVDPEAVEVGLRPDALTEAIFESAAVAVIATNERGVITRWNHAAERLLGWGASEAVGRLVNIIIPDDRRFEIAAITSALGRGDEIRPIDTVRRAKDGSAVRVELRVSPVLDVGGNLVGVSNMLVENSEQVETRRALAASESRYRALVDALAEFVLITDLKGAVVTAQPSWCAYTGQDERSCRGSGWREAMHPHDRAELEQQWADGSELLTPFSISGRLRHGPTGEYRYCEASVVPRRDHAGRVVEYVVAMSDVHERHIAQERERQTAERFRQIYASNVFGVCYGEKHRILDANEAMLDMLGLDRDALAGGIPAERLVMTPAVDLDAPFGDVGSREFEVRRPDGSHAYLHASGVSLHPDRGWLAVAVDLTERRKAEREAEHRALHDHLTGLPNRRLLIDRLEHALSRSARHESLVGVLFCDLDHFKEINDIFGHKAGDEVLRVVATRIQGLLREGDTVARAGGDEFVVVLEDLAEPDDAARIAERVRAALVEAIPVEDRRLHVTASIGVSISNGLDDRVEALLNRSDDAMYRAKRDGRDQIAVGSSPTDSHSQRRWVERELKRALAEDGLDIAFQPVIDLRDGQPVGAEALLRWQVDGYAIPAARAIEVAEETGIIVRVSDWMLQAACAQFSAWRLEHPEAAGWKLHVNISARDLADEHFVERVLTGIRAGNCVPTDVCLEITETAMLKHPERAHSRLSELRDIGIVVAIDDFGTGYASLGVLRDVPADIVKIDRSFVIGLSKSERDRAIVGHAIELAHRLGLIVVGEGVETLAQMAILDELGCDRAQGYVFAKPQPVADLPVTI